MTDDHQRQLIEIWKAAMAEWTQAVLGSIGSDSFSLESILSLPTGREKLPGRQTLRAGTPGRPARRDWRFTAQRGIYCDFVEWVASNPDLYIGKASSFPEKSTQRGLNARLAQYIQARARGYMSKMLLTWHEKCLVSEKATISLQCLAIFEDDIPREAIDLFKDILTIWCQTFKDRRSLTHPSVNPPEAVKLFEHCGQGVVPHVPWKGLNVAIQSTDALCYGLQRICVVCGRNSQEVKAAGDRLRWRSIHARIVFGPKACSYTCHKTECQRLGKCLRCDQQAVVGLTLCQMHHDEAMLTIIIA